MQLSPCLRDFMESIFSVKIMDVLGFFVLFLFLGFVVIVAAFLHFFSLFWFFGGLRQRLSLYNLTALKLSM